MSPVCARCGTTNAESARFCQACGSAIQLDEPRGQQSRKTVTVVFSDLVDSTAIGETLDAETLISVLDQYFDAAREVIETHGGVVEKFIGDAIMAVFGIPRTHEDDALRAVRAAIGMRETLSRLNRELGLEHGVSMRSRTGVNTGVVVVGDAPDGRRLATGDPVNVAARLEQAAPPEGIVLGHSTYRLVRDAVTVRSMGSLQLKGKSAPTAAYELLELTPTADLLGPRRITPLVGREAELALIRSQFAAARNSGLVETVLITGEPGVGKTRLVGQAVDGLGDGATVLTAACTPYGASTFWPVSQLLSSGAPSGQPFDLAALRELANRAEIDEADAVVDRVGSLLTLNDGAFPIAESFWAIARLLGSFRGPDPLVLVIEDLHWAETSLLDLIDHIRMSGQGPSMLIMATARPGLLTRRWSGDAPWHLNRVSLLALSRSQSDSLIDGILGDDRMPSATREILHDAAEGNPLFLQQAITDWIEEGVLVRGEKGWSLASAVSEVKVPGSVRAVFEARLDRLAPPERAVLGAAAVAGLTVTTDALGSMLSESGSAGLTASLEYLVGNDLLRVGHQSDATDLLSFPHASMRDVAYAMTLKSDRARYHERFAQWRTSVGEASQRDEVVGHHLAEAYRYRSELRHLDPRNVELGLRASRRLVAACKRAVAVGDRPAAERLLDRVGALLAAVPEESMSEELPLLEESARLMVSMGAWSAVAELLRPYERAGHGPLLRDLGVALCQLHRSDRGSTEFRNGQRLLELASEAPGGDNDALASLAGTWKGTDDQRAQELYRRCLAHDPGDPYPLGNVVEHELSAAGGLAVLDEFGEQINAAIERCRGQGRAGLNLPWAFFDLAKFALLAGRTDEAMATYSRAVYLSTADHMLVTSLESLRRIDASGAAVPGVAWAQELLVLARTAHFPEQVAAEEAPGGADISGLDPASRVLLLVGGTEETAHAWIQDHRDEVVEAFRDFDGVVVSGGTNGGTPGLAGDVGSRHPSIRTVGYLPSRLPTGVEPDPRYDELRRTPDDVFSIGQSLRMWADLMASGVRPADVRVLAINGGAIASLEFRIALALGATVGVVADSGREADGLLDDPDWVAAPTLTRLRVDGDSISTFLSTDRRKQP